MTCYLNNTAANGGGQPVQKDPDLASGAVEEGGPVGGIHDLLSGGHAQDFVANQKRVWPLKWTGLTNTQWVTNIRAFLISGLQLYWQSPEMSAKVPVLLQGKYHATQRILKGDAANAPHWDVSLTVLEA